MRKTELYPIVIDWFQENIPIAETELNYENEYQLLVAVILSAQCTDKRINTITPALFQAYPNPKALAQSSVAEIFEYIKSVSYPNNKAKHLFGMGTMVTDEYIGVIPRTREELMKLPGVGRKTANVIASVIHNEPAMAVDTHVFRVSQRIGLVNKSKTPLQVELQLLKYVPKELVPKFHHWLILHGRYACVARSPKCEICGLKSVCKYFGFQQLKLQKSVDKQD
ncbi:MAG: endonuclease III [Bacteroidota bacterium]|nr:endonuclease III [Bacteroidota bacterium]